MASNDAQPQDDESIEDDQLEQRPIISSLQNMTISSDADDTVVECDQEDDTALVDSELKEYGFSLPDLYKLSLQFYKKGKRALNFTYDDKLMLTAYWKQVSSGKYDPGKMPDIGYLDVIGNDRRKAWQSLGDMNASEAMTRFCKLLKKNCNEFNPFIEAQRRDREEKERVKREALEQAQREKEEKKRKEEEKRKAEEEAERKRLEEEAAAAAEEEKRVQEQQEQERKRLEEIQRQEEEENLKKTEEEDKGEDQGDIVHTHPVVFKQSLNGISERGIAPASLWTRPKLQEFIQYVKRDASSVIVVGRGETVTIRVPTHENGSCLFWEFATEGYDVGFGVYFEWSTPPSHDVKVTVDESDEESGDELTKDSTEEEDTNQSKAPVDQVVPVVRRNSHVEVIVGSHIYPGQGVYLLKFDNSYSLLRSKTLYYRVYYTR